MKKIILLLLVICSHGLMAQRDALYYQYLFNYHVLNPAFSGSLEKMSAVLINRNQWVGIKGAPHTLTFDLHTPIRNDKIALGFYIYSDRLGPWTNFGMISTYAYRVELDKGKLSFGLQMGFNQIDIDWDMILMEHMDDYYLLTRPRPKILPDANFGIYYYTDQYFIGISSKHLFDRAFSETGTEEGNNYSTLSRHFYSYLGGFIHLDKNLILKPSLLFKYVDKGVFCYDVNMQLMVRNLIWFGASFRSNYNSFVLLTELRLSSKLKLGYSFDTYLGDVKAYNIGTHEFKVSYEVDIYKRRNMFPVYF
jgi:type IX secretion system PorP/SprF family membrane protein